MEYNKKPGGFFTKIWFWIDFGSWDIFVFWCIFLVFPGFWSKFWHYHCVPGTSIGLCATFYHSIRSGKGPIDQRILRSLFCITGRCSGDKGEGCSKSFYTSRNANPMDASAVSFVNTELVIHSAFPHFLPRGRCHTSWRWRADFRPLSRLCQWETKEYRRNGRHKSSRSWTRWFFVILYHFALSLVRGWLAESLLSDRLKTTNRYHR